MRILHFLDRFEFLNCCLLSFVFSVFLKFAETCIFAEILIDHDMQCGTFCMRLICELDEAAYYKFNTIALFNALICILYI